EGGEARVRRGAADEGIDAAAVAVFVLALDPLHVAVGPVPDARWLVRKDARAADFGAQQAAHRQVNVSHHLGLNAEARAASQKLVIRIALLKLGGHARGLAVRSRGDDLPLDGLHAPALTHELRCQPVEKLRVSGRLALGPKIFAGLNDRVAENFLPKAVYGDAGRQRVILIH